MRNLLDTTILSSCINSMVTSEGEYTKDASLSCSTALCTYVVRSSCQRIYTCAASHTTNDCSKEEILFHNIYLFVSN